jgi:pectate lyase
MGRLTVAVIAGWLGAGLAEAAPLGWASLDAEGQDGTPGGTGGRVVTVSTAADLDREARAAGPAVIKVAGTLRFDELRPASDKTIEGAGPGATLVGSIAFVGRLGAPLKNLVLRNLVIRNAAGAAEDAIAIRFAHHVWIDHCDVSDSPDGLIDMTHAADYITVSWTKIWYSDPSQSHRFSMLISHSDDNAAEDRGRLRVTLHHNWWAQNVTERMPRVRFGQIHVFNNYFSSVGNNYCVGAGVEARIRVENNHFDGVKDPHIFYDDEPTAQIVASGNVYTGISNTTRKQTGQGAAFTPPYPAAMDAGTGVKALVMAGAGPQWGTATALAPAAGSRATPLSSWIPRFTSADGRDALGRSGLFRSAP